MPINANKPELWKADIAASVDLFNSWFTEFAPVTFRAERIRATEDVERDLRYANDLIEITPEILREHPDILPTLRMSTAPPIARDRLIGLAHVRTSLVHTMEKGLLPARMEASMLQEHLERVCAIIVKLLDRDIFPWLLEERPPSDIERIRASTIVADRRCGATADPIIRNAQERRQLAVIEEFLTTRGYSRKPHPSDDPITRMEPGTFSFRMTVVVGRAKQVNMPIDVVIQPKRTRPDRLPILIEAKSAGDFTNTNKRRKEEATKIRQLRDTYGETAQLILFLCGYFDSGYLGYEAAEGIDWVWEHRIQDLLQLGLDG